MSHKSLNTNQGHWVLARMGKKVLRPGGKELTNKLINGLGINEKHKVVEFAPGLGYTASKVLNMNPLTYTGIELNEDAAQLLRKKIKGENRSIIVANASDTTLADNSVDIVYGEAMLTMQSPKGKRKIIEEAKRILKPGGFYGIHELGLYPDEMSEESKSQIQRDLSESIKVNARPLTIKEWTNLFVENGFTVQSVCTNAMCLLEKKRIIDDEGIFRTLKITYNILTHPKERKIIYTMRAIFRKHKESLNAVAIVVSKN